MTLSVDDPKSHCYLVYPFDLVDMKGYRNLVSHFDRVDDLKDLSSLIGHFDSKDHVGLVDNFDSVHDPL